MWKRWHSIFVICRYFEVVLICVYMHSFLDDAFRKNLESALRFGNPLLVQDVESYDPILNPVLNRELRRTGGRVLITLGDQDIDLSPSFTIFLSTRDPTVRVIVMLLLCKHFLDCNVNTVNWNLRVKLLKCLKLYYIRGSSGHRRSYFSKLLYNEWFSTVLVGILLIPLIDLIVAKVLFVFCQSVHFIPLLAGWQEGHPAYKNLCHLSLQSLPEQVGKKTEGELENPGWSGKRMWWCTIF